MDEKETIEILIFGQRYAFPDTLTILSAFEWAGFHPVRGVGCRGGFCGACGTVYRLPGDPLLHYALACQKRIEAGMLLAQIPFFPAPRPAYRLENLAAPESALLTLFPDLTRCYGCNTCTKACPQELDVLGYIAAALSGDLSSTAALSFDCVHCGLCVARCPAGLDPPGMALLARRIWGRYFMPRAGHLEEQVESLGDGDMAQEVAALKALPEEALKARYASRQIEP
jgi:ferredoxin